MGNRDNRSRALSGRRGRCKPPQKPEVLEREKKRELRSRVEIIKSLAVETFERSREFPTLHEAMARVLEELRTAVL